MALARIKVQRTGFQVALFAVAALFALVGLALFNLAAYHAMVPRLGPALAALAVGGANLLLAAIALIIALKARPGSAGEKMAQEIRDLASDEIKKDVDEVRDDISRISDEIAGIRAGLGSVREAVPGGVRSVVDLADSVRKKLDGSD
jgi:succinate dehydrogenase/fumarate reductase flavoprotein subunit